MQKKTHTYTHNISTVGQTTKKLKEGINEKKKLSYLH